MSETPRSSRRLVLFVGAVFAVESAFFAVVAPLVPGLVREVHLTTVEVGFLVAAYPAGVLLAAIPSMAFVDRWGVRTTTLAGIGILIALRLRGNEEWLQRAGEIVGERRETPEELAHRSAI